MLHTGIRLFTFLALHCLWIGLIQADEPLTIFTNAKILTVDHAFSISDSMAIKNGRIVAVGLKATELAKHDKTAVIIDLNGKTVLPGLMDSHAHPVGAATYEHDHEIPDIQNIQQLLDHISDRSAKQPERSLITIRQVFITRLKEQRYPTRAELDRAAPGILWSSAQALTAC